METMGAYYQWDENGNDPDEKVYGVTAKQWDAMTVEKRVEQMCKHEGTEYVPLRSRGRL